MSWAPRTRAVSKKQTRDFPVPASQSHPPQSPTRPYPAPSRPHRAPKARKRPPHVLTAAPDAAQSTRPCPGRRVRAIILEKDLDDFHISASGRQERWRQAEVVVRGDVIAVLEVHADYFFVALERRRMQWGLYVGSRPLPGRSCWRCSLSRSMPASSVCPLREAKFNGVYLPSSRNLHVGTTLKKQTSN